MKYLKYIVLLLSIFSATSIFISCQTEEIYNIKSTNRAQVKYISFKEFSSKHSAKQKFIEIEKKNKQALTSRLIYSQEYNFLIDTDQILFFQYDDYISYTFKVYRS